MSSVRTTVEDPAPATLKLLAYCQANDWAGHDPYDALNSRIFQKLPFLDSRWPRLLMTQVLKGDIRVIVPKEYADTTAVFPWKG